MASWRLLTTAVHIGLVIETLQLRLARLVAAEWPEMTAGGCWCPELSGRLAGAFEAAGLTWILLVLSDRIGADDPRDFHYAVLSDGDVYDLTYRQFDPEVPVPYVRAAGDVFAEWRDVRALNPIGWMRGRMGEGAALYRMHALLS